MLQKSLLSHLQHLLSVLQQFLLQQIIEVKYAAIKDRIVYAIARTISSAVPPKAKATTKNIAKNIPATFIGYFINVYKITDNIIIAIGIAKKTSKVFI